MAWLRVGVLVLLWGLPSPVRAIDGAVGRFEALPVVKLMASAVRAPEANDRDLRAMVAAALRIYSLGEGGGGGILANAMPTDTTYLVAAMVAQLELMRRGVTPADHAVQARLAASLACGIQRAGESWGALLASERSGGHGQPFIKERGDALAASLPALVEVARELARVHGAAALVAVPTHAGTLRALGELELSAERWDEAAGYLRRYLERAPDANEARLTLGFALLVGGHGEDGERELAAVVRMEPRLLGAADAVRRRAALATVDESVVDRPLGEALGVARRLAEVGRMGDAAALAGALLARHPDDPDVVALAGGLLVASGRMGDWFALAMREPLRSAGTPALVETLAAGRVQALLQAAASPETTAGDLTKLGTAARAAVERVAAVSPERAAMLGLMVGALPPLARARATGGDAAEGRAQAERLLKEHDGPEARRLAAMLLVGAGAAKEAADLLRPSAGAGDSAALDLAELELHIGGRGADVAALERALALAEGVAARSGATEEGSACAGGRCATRARALAVHAQAEAALALLSTDGEHEQRALGAVAAAQEAIPLLDPMDPQQRNADIALHLLLARGALGAGKLEAARQAVERARLDDPAAPDVELFMALLAVMDKDWVAARDLLERASLLMPNPRLELAIRKWRLFVADQLADRRAFVTQLRALEALWELAVPPGLPPEAETLVIGGATQLQATWEVTDGVVPRVGLTQRLTVVPAQRQLTREVVRSLVGQLPGGAAGDE
ncbi:MAG: GDP-mannose pyrophosphatase NudK [Myxococcales bacterium]